MRFGIPAYRLPRDVLDAEVHRILDWASHWSVNAPSPTSQTEIAERRHSTRPSSPSARRSAAAPTSRRATRPGSSTRSRCCMASRMASAPLLGRRVAVYGGGDTAMDAARTARRLGAEEAVVVYRRTRDRMPAHDFEVRGAIEEGVADEVALHGPRRAGEGALTLERMELDEQGFPQPTGELEELDADCARAGPRPGRGSVAAGARARRRDRRRRGEGGRSDDDRPCRAFRRRGHGAGASGA